MTEKMCEMLNGDNYEWTDYSVAKSQRCHLSSWNWFLENGQIPEYAKGTGEWCLHHIDPTMKYFDILKYAEWNLSDVVPMPTSEHQKLHQDLKKRNKEYGFLDKLMLMRLNAK